MWSSVDEIEITDVDEEADYFADDEDGVETIDSIREQRDTSRDREIPERDWNDTSFLMFGCDPLEYDSHSEERLAKETDGDPNLLPHTELG